MNEQNGSKWIRSINKVFFGFQEGRKGIWLVRSEVPVGAGICTILLDGKAMQRDQDIFYKNQRKGDRGSRREGQVRSTVLEVALFCKDLNCIFLW